ncbi:MAG: ABC transporter substrate-binding protein [Acidimicrobiales bacterium]|nr:ABC transporter substrate-binding protein [Acidimicrobiales bacterium]
MKKLLALLMALSLLAAACGDDGGSDASGGDDGATVEGDGDGDDAGGGDDGGTDDGDTGDDDGGTDDGDDGEPVDLTASFRGVTEETITIGVAAIDAEALLDFGFDFGNVPLEPLLQSWADTLNENGGIHGRNVQFVHDVFLPIGDAEQAESCLIMMEDEEVFVVMGQMLGDNPLCITETYGHPYVGHFGETPGRQERSEGRFFATEISQLPQRIGGVTRMIEDGDFEGKSVAVTWQASEDQVYADGVLPILADAGVDVVAEIEVGDTTEDTVANANAWDRVIERIKSDGADVILHLSGIVGPLDAVGRAAGTDIEIALTNGQAADGTTVVSRSTAPDDVRENSFAVTTYKPGAEVALADEGVQQCLGEYEAWGGDMDELEMDNDDFVNGIVNWCRVFRLTTAILEAAGPELNPESFIAGGESLGDIVLPAMPNGSIRPDKHSAGSELIRYVYDTELGHYVTTGDPFLGAFG